MKVPDIRQKAAGLLSTFKLPPRTDESWRRVNLAGLDLGGFGSAPSGNTSFSVVSCQDASVEQNDAIPDLNGFSFEPADIFECFNAAEADRSVFVRMGKTGHVRVRHEASGQRLVHRVYVFVPDGAEAVFIEDFSAPGSEQALLSHEVQIHCGKGSSLKYLSIRRYSPSVWNFHRVRAQVKRDANLHASMVHNGGHVGKTFVGAVLEEPGATFRGVGVTTLGGREFLDAEMTAEHPSDHTSSSLHYKTVLRGRAHSVFNGNLMIPPGTKDVHSHQTNNNILLDPTARAESQPRLVIQSEDVSAEHGATVGEIDLDALFFLMSRGIPEVDSRQLLMTGFLSQITEELPLDPEEREEILAESLRRLYDAR
jgi:Fe-S cluster assembly scaffold protein SufB